MLSLKLALDLIPVEAQTNQGITGKLSGFLNKIVARIFTHHLYGRKRYWNDSYFKAVESIKNIANKHHLTLVEVGLTRVHICSGSRAHYEADQPTHV